MNKLSKLLLVLCLLLQGAAFAQESVLQKGQSFILRISGVPSDEISLVSQKYGISDAGTIRLPYLKDAISAAGLKPSDLARKLESAYRAAEIYTQPTIQVDASGGGAGGGSERFLSVMGEIKAPRSVGYSPGMTLLDAIAQCGGFTDFADKKKVKLTRGSTVTYHRLSTSDPSENAKLQPNDIITISPNKGIFR